jgi:hypothetical protein
MHGLLVFLPCCLTVICAIRREIDAFASDMCMARILAIPIRRMAALTSIFLTVLSPGKTIIIPDDLYHGTRTICGNLMKQWQVTTVAIDMSNMDDVKR